MLLVAAALVLLGQRPLKRLALLDLACAVT